MSSEHGVLNIAILIAHMNESQTSDVGPIFQHTQMRMIGLNMILFLCLPVTLSACRCVCPSDRRIQCYQSTNLHSSADHRLLFGNRYLHIEHDAMTPENHDARCFQIINSSFTTGGTWPHAVLWRCAS